VIERGPRYGVAGLLRVELRGRVDCAHLDLDRLDFLHLALEKGVLLAQAAQGDGPGPGGIDERARRVVPIGQEEPLHPDQDRLGLHVRVAARGLDGRDVGVDDVLPFELDDAAVVAAPDRHALLRVELHDVAVDLAAVPEADDLGRRAGRKDGQAECRDDHDDGVFPH